MWRLFTYVEPAQPPRGPPVRSMKSADHFGAAAAGEAEGAARRGSVSGDERRGGGPADVVDGGGGGGGSHVGSSGGGGRVADGGPADAFEMIMASLGYKLELREKAYRDLARKGGG